MEGFIGGPQIPNPKNVHPQIPNPKNIYSSNPKFYPLKSQIFTMPQIPNILTPQIPNYHKTAPVVGANDLINLYE